MKIRQIECDEELWAYIFFVLECECECESVFYLCVRELSSWGWQFMCASRINSNDDGDSERTTIFNSIQNANCFIDDMMTYTNQHTYTCECAYRHAKMSSSKVVSRKNTNQAKWKRTPWLHTIKCSFFTRFCRIWKLQAKNVWNFRNNKMTFLRYIKCVFKCEPAIYISRSNNETNGCVDILSAVSTSFRCCECVCLYFRVVTEI